MPRFKPVLLSVALSSFASLANSAAYQFEVVLEVVIRDCTPSNVIICTPELRSFQQIISASYKVEGQQIIDYLANYSVRGGLLYDGLIASNVTGDFSWDSEYNYTIGFDGKYLSTMGFAFPPKYYGFTPLFFKDMYSPEGFWLSSGSNGSVALGSFTYSTISAVPEPEKFVMLLAGVAVMGAVARRKSKAGN